MIRVRELHNAKRSPVIYDTIIIIRQLDKEVFNWEHPHFNPQEHLNNTFSQNDSSRLLIKDKHREQHGNESRFEVLLPHYKSSAKGSQQPCYNKKDCPFEKTI